MLKLSENPPRMHPGAGILTDLAGTWWVAHTKARSEKALAWDLLRRDIGYFLPLLERVRFSGGRKRRVLMPLFPSYVFVCGSDDDRYAAMTTDRIFQTVRVADQGGLIAELAAIERALAWETVLDPYPYAATGRRCRIKAGPFRGLEGLVVQRAGQARLVLEVTILGQGAAMEVEPDLLEPVD